MNGHPGTIEALRGALEAISMLEKRPSHRDVVPG